MGASVIIAAAGTAQRMQGIDKLMYQINGIEVFMYSVFAFAKSKCTDKIVVVTSQIKIDKIKEIMQKAMLKLPFEVVCGGDTRQSSVLNGLKACCEYSDCIMIHDAARPMITPELIEKLYNKVIIEKVGAAALGVPVKDTIKQVDENDNIISTPTRNQLRIAQTPQAFEIGLYRNACKEAEKNKKDYTDDCQLVEAIGKRVRIVEGLYSNIKITTPEDIILAQAFLKECK